MADSTDQRKLAAIMFTDMVGFSALVQRNEKLALELLADSQRLLRTQFLLFNGREVKTTGDGFLVEFPSALDATQCAVEIQRAIVARNATQSSERHVHVRIGIHVGDVVHREADMYGDGVNIAARIEPLAIGGGICLSDTVYAQVRNKLDVGLTKLDSPELKHIEIPMDVYRVVLPWQQQPTVASKPGSLPSSRPIRRTLLVGAATVIVLLATGAGWWVLHQLFKGKSQTASPPVASTSPAAYQKSIAVLPFVNMSADKNDEYLSDGMTEELLNVLGQAPGLHVPGRTSCFAFKGKTEDGTLRRVGEQLHVSTVLEGSVLKSGDRLRITAQLVNVDDGFQLWGHTYNGDVRDVLSVQTNVAQQVVQALQVKLGVEATRALAKAPTENPEAHRLYLMGRHYLFKGTEEGNRRAVAYFNHALQKDPNYARAYCGLADTLGDFKLAPKDSYPKLRAYAETALKLDPNLAEAHISIGVILFNFDWDFLGAEKEFQQALRLNPNLALAYDWYAYYLAVRGRFTEAIAEQKKALDLDPLAPGVIADLGGIYYISRDFDRAIETAKQAAELDSNYPWSYVWLGWSLIEQGKPREAIPQFKKLLSLADYPWTRTDLASGYAAAGDRAKAEAVLKELKERQTSQFVPSYPRAAACAFLKDKERALELLEQAVAERDSDCVVMNVDPALDSLRNGPRFQALLKRVGFDK